MAVEDYSNFNKYEQQSMSETTVPSGSPKCFSRFLRVSVAQSLIFRFAVGLLRPFIFQ
jgi:hypothetical protein